MNLVTCVESLCMRNLSGLILALVVSAFALPAANVPPDTVVARSMANR